MSSPSPTAGSPQGNTESPTYGIDADVQYPGKDAQTDSGRMGDCSSKPARDVGHQVDARVETLADEKNDQGWDLLAKPVGGTPAGVSTAGTRGGPITTGDSMGADR